MSPRNALLDLDQPARQATWRFNLTDPQLQDIGVIEVDRDAPPTMSVDTGRSVKRVLTSLRLLPNVLDDIDVIKDRMRVTMVLADGTEWSQGIYMFSDVSRAIVTAGLSIGALNLVDQNLIVDQQLDRSISYSPGKQITVAMTELLAELPIQFTVSPLSAVISPEGEAVAWPAGTSRLRVINELATMIGYHDLYFDNQGLGRLGLMPNPEQTAESAVLSYPLGGRTYLGSATRSTDLLELPNRFVVLNNGVTNEPVYGIYDVPATAEHSYANRGFLIPHVEQQQGIATAADALTAAESLARHWRFAHETVQFDGPPDPRHDHYDTVDFEGTRFLELQWNMQLTEGSEMSHVIRRTYEGGSSGDTV